MRPAATARHPDGVGVGKEAGEVLHEMREEAAWSAWVVEGGSGAGTWLCCYQRTRARERHREMGERIGRAEATRRVLVFISANRIRRISQAHRIPL